jgi:CheY-like chemotaxis protein
MFALGGPAGVRAARLERPHVILCDLGLYDMKGLNVCRELRVDPNTDNSAFIFFTKSFHTKDSIATALNFGADDCLPECSGVDIIAAKINWLVERKQKEMAHKERYQILKSRQMQIADIFRSVVLPGTLEAKGSEFTVDTSVSEPRMTGTTAANVFASLAGLLDEQIKTLDGIEIEGLPYPYHITVDLDLVHQAPTTNETLVFESVM